MPLSLIVFIIFFVVTITSALFRLNIQLPYRENIIIFSVIIVGVFLCLGFVAQKPYKEELITPQTIFRDNKSTMVWHNEAGAIQSTEAYIWAAPTNQVYIKKIYSESPFKFKKISYQIHAEESKENSENSEENNEKAII
jgi:hypothetical protein